MSETEKVGAEPIKYPYWENDAWLDHLVGRKVVAADMDSATLLLSDGTRVVFQKENRECCSWIELVRLATTDNIITSARLQDNDRRDGGYDAWLTVVTEAGEFNIAEADGDASNGYYLHGFALGVTVYPAEESL